MSVPFLKEAANAGETDKLIRFVRLHLGDGNEDVGRKEIDKSWVEAIKILLRYDPVDENTIARVLSSEEVGPAVPADYGLGKDALRVTVRGPTDATFVVRFGARNPLGVARYVRIDGIDGVPLLAAYVAESWQQAIGTDTR